MPRGSRGCTIPARKRGVGPAGGGMLGAMAQDVLIRAGRGLDQGVQWWQPTHWRVTDVTSGAPVAIASSRKAGQAALDAHAAGGGQAVMHGIGPGGDRVDGPHWPSR